MIVWIPNRKFPGIECGYQFAMHAGATAIAWTCGDSVAIADVEELRLLQRQLLMPTRMLSLAALLRKEAGCALKQAPHFLCG
jgi:hypothetical protein